MDVAAAQAEMSSAYLRGAPGVLVSCAVWAATGLAIERLSLGQGLLVLGVGGAMIYPVSAALCKLLPGTGRVSGDNPLERLGFETTFVVFAGVIASVCLYFLDVGFFVLPLAALLIGARYVVFRTIYGEPIYFVLGLVLVAIGAVAAFEGELLPLPTAFLVAGAELAFAVLLFLRARPRQAPRA